MQRVEVEIDWEPVGPVRWDGTDLVFPRMPPGGGVYRYRLSLQGRTRTYIGEAEAYGRRFYQYARPGPTQSTNLKMRARLERLLSAHAGTAEIDVARQVLVRVDGTEADPVVLPPTFVRRLVENAALVAAAAQGDELVNGPGYPPGELWGDT